MIAAIEVSKKFAARVDSRSTPLGCWPWVGKLTPAGYGQSRVKEDGRWRTAGAHQIAHYLATGRWERGAHGRLVRHLCRNRRCCNPAHLRGGTAQDNADDRVSHDAGEVLVRRNPLALPVVGVANLPAGWAVDPATHVILNRGLGA